MINYGANFWAFFSRPLESFIMCTSGKTWNFDPHPRLVYINIATVHKFWLHPCITFEKNFVFQLGQSCQALYLNYAYLYDNILPQHNSIWMVFVRSKFLDPFRNKSFNFGLAVFFQIVPPTFFTCKYSVSTRLHNQTVNLS